MKKIKIQVMGSGCPTCKILFNKVSEIAKNINSELKVDYITDITKIIELGIMSTPVFAINDQIISAGKIPNDQIIKQNILDYLES